MEEDTDEDDEEAARRRYDDLLWRDYQYDAYLYYGIKIERPGQYHEVEMKEEEETTPEIVMSDGSEDDDSMEELSFNNNNVDVCPRHREYRERDYFWSSYQSYRRPSSTPPYTPSSPCCPSWNSFPF